MTTGSFKHQVDALWNEFWTGGVTNPLTVIEQISYLLFARMLDRQETRDERIFHRRNKGQSFPGKRFKPDEQHLRWQQLKNEADPERLLVLMRDEVIPHLRALGGKESVFGTYLKDAQLLIQKPSLVRSAIQMIDDFPLDRGDSKGDLYEYLLGKLTTAGINGQFRTPRHIIGMMVELIDPRPDQFETVIDPACGTAGFLVETMDYLLRKYTSEEGKLIEGGDITYTGDLLEPYREHIQNQMFWGFDFDISMLRIATMNLMLHDVANPQVNYQDSLSGSFPDRFPAQASPEGFFDVVLANPPFKGALDQEDIDAALSSKVRTRKTELLFLVRMLQLLKPGGRAAVVVPDGVLFGSQKAHRSVRELLVEHNQLDAVISLPSGVFRPYAGVSTAILLFTRGGSTEDVWFYDVEHDGFSLDDKRTPEPEKTNLPDVVARWQNRKAETKRARTEQSFYVPKAEIVENDYDLSINRYKEIEYEAVEYDPPKVILKRVEKLEEEIAKGREELEGLLKCP